MKISACVAILAGGQGTRLVSRTGDLPKPMVPVSVFKWFETDGLIS